MVRKLIYTLVAAFALTGCGEGPTQIVLEDPDGDPIELEENTGRGLTDDPQPEPQPEPVAGRRPVRIKNRKN